MVTLQQYAQEVKKMRDLQSRYFQTRSSIFLISAKSQERKVDDITSEILQNSSYGKINEMQDGHSSNGY